MQSRSHKTYLIMTSSLCVLGYNRLKSSSEKNIKREEETGLVRKMDLINDFLLLEDRRKLEGLLLIFKNDIDIRHHSSYFVFSIYSILPINLFNFSKNDVAFTIPISGAM
jgi:hypothetical protein